MTGSPIPAAQGPIPPAARDGFWTLRAASDELLHTDLMRFIAASGIVLTHSWRFLLPPGERLDPEFGKGLALFVDVFFVISGFVITHVYAGRIGSWRDYGRFMQRRVGRLVPLHWLTLAASVAFFALVSALNFKVQNAPTLSSECLSSAALLVHAVWLCGGNIPNGVSWSISAEMLMYLLFPVFLLVANIGRLALAGLGCATFVAAFYHYGGMAHWNDLDAFRAFPAFILGVLLGRSKPLLAQIPRAWAMALGSTGLLFAGSFLGWHFGVLLAFAYLSAAFALAADCARKAGPVVARWAPLGQLTYSIYMIHLLVVTILINGVADKLLHLPVGQMRIVVVAGYVLIGLLSLASFKLVETPARIWIDRLPLFRRD